MNKPNTIRPLEHLKAAGAAYPEAWKQAESFIQDRGHGLPDWPSWCFVPMAAWYAIVCNRLHLESLTIANFHEVARLAALGSWRITQGIYHFHPAIFAELCQTEMSGDLPSEVFKRLPEWCLYIDTPDFVWSGIKSHGFFTHLEHDANDGRTELRFLVDTGKGLVPFIIHIGKWSLEESLQRVAREGYYWINDAQKPAFDSLYKSGAAIKAAEPLLALVLYLCSKDPEYKGGDVPSKPATKKTKKGWRLFPAAGPRVWSIGYELGAAIERARAAGSTPDKSRPRAHMRKAHWHGYWVGPKSEAQEFTFRWLPPIAVNADLWKEENAQD